MRILFDQGTPVPLREHLARYEIATAYEKEWSSFKNGNLLDAAEREGFEILVTTDFNLKYQQHLDSRRIAIVVLTTTSWHRIERAVAAVTVAVDNARGGSYAEVQIP